MTIHASSIRPPGPRLGGPAAEAAEIHRHLAEAAVLLRQQSTPLDPEVMRIALDDRAQHCGRALRAR
jgi:histidinol-phosphate/aromatic aminotransferase/cobyric acid decarboxylase-like protein